MPRASNREGPPSCEVGPRGDAGRILATSLHAALIIPFTASLLTEVQKNMRRSASFGQPPSSPSSPSPPWFRFIHLSITLYYRVPENTSRDITSLPLTDYEFNYNIFLQVHLIFIKKYAFN